MMISPLFYCTVLCILSLSKQLGVKTKTNTILLLVKTHQRSCHLSTHVVQHVNWMRAVGASLFVLCSYIWCMWGRFCNNQPTGCIPEGVGFLSEVDVLDVSYNALSGICQIQSLLFEIEVINLAHNHYLGFSIRVCFRW